MYIEACKMINMNENKLITKIKISKKGKDFILLNFA